MANWTSGDVQANGLRLHYTRTGGGQPALVLVHGFSDDGLCWTALAERLQDRYDVVMPDARCHGRSEAPEAPFTFLDRVADLAGLITALDLRQPVILGHSMGAITALLLACRRPEVPRAVVLEDPPPWWSPSADPPVNDSWNRRQRAWIESLQSQTREAVIAGQRAAAPTWPEAELGPWADSKLRLHRNTFRQVAPAGLDWPAALGQLACPALLITADPVLGALVTPAQAAELLALSPHLQLAHVPGAGHNVRREQGERYWQALEAFLK
jgi:N-formylmaleamate deformylase